MIISPLPPSSQCYGSAGALNQWLQQQHLGRGIILQEVVGEYNKTISFLLENARIIKNSMGCGRFTF